ncbi:succinate dehydrogenase assembly factor 2 [Ceratobasidium sp. AG-Ba]|nr:succinate dehydrogenase assembly factor 2 [Ceratobasidium sp. AG-Ba]
MVDEQKRQTIKNFSLTDRDLKLDRGLMLTTIDRLVMQRAILFGRACVQARTQTRFRSSGPALADDPYPLPLSKNVPGDDSDLDSSLLPPPISRPNESLPALRARLVYQTRKRGTLESDLLLSTFAKEHLPSMSEAELREFDKLLDEPDWDILLGDRQTIASTALGRHIAPR